MKKVEIDRETTIFICGVVIDALNNQSTQWGGVEFNLKNKNLKQYYTT